jgi:hypothetical protein
MDFFPGRQLADEEFAMVDSTLLGQLAHHVSSGLASPERFAKARLHPIRVNPLPPGQRLAEAR